MATPSIPNAQTADQFNTSFVVEIEPTVGGDISEATVTMTSGSGPVTLVPDPSAPVWQGAVGGYDGVYQLDIEAGSNALTGVRVEGPDIHQIATPTAGGSLQANSGAVAWTREVPAFRVTIGGANLGESLEVNEDVGIEMTNPFEIGPSPNDTLSITRTNQITPNGAADMSVMSVAITNSVPIVITH